MDLGLKDKAAVVTGGSIGIGLAIAAGLAQEGVHLVQCARNEERLTASASEIRSKYGVWVIGVQTDVAQGSDMVNLVQRTEQAFGGADILINNAGTGSEETIMDAPDKRWNITGVCTLWLLSA